MEGWLAAIQDMAHPGDDALSLFRRRAWDRFLELGLPKGTSEPFQYVRWEGGPKRQLDELTVEGALSLPFAMRSYGLYLQNRIARGLIEEQDPFAALNCALFQEGKFLYVPPGTVATATAEVGGGAPRLHLHVGRGAELQLKWNVQTAAWRTSMLDIVLEEGASLTLVERAEEQQGPSFQALRVLQKRNSRLNVKQVGRGGPLSRTSVRIQLVEEGAEAHFSALTRLEGSAQSHIHALVEHQAPHCRSRQHVKGSLRGSSRSSFEGKILVRSVAQKTEAYQLCNHLLLSPEATAYAKPNLEIFADDVKASHGATVAQLSEEELFYLQSRGIPLAEARELLIEAFCRELA